MEHIINLLRLTQEQRSAFARAAQGHEQIFAPDGTAPDGSPLPAPNSSEPKGPGMTALTRSTALPWSTPVGSPVLGSRSIFPFSGSGVSLVMPAAARAKLLTLLAPKIRSITTGFSGLAASRS